jgi:hypothetical protein
MLPLSTALASREVLHKAFQARVASKLPPLARAYPELMSLFFERSTMLSSSITAYRRSSLFSMRAVTRPVDMRVLLISHHTLLAGWTEYGNYCHTPCLPGLP